MEEVLDNQLATNGLTVSSTFKDYLQKQAYWGRFLGLGLMILYGIFLLLIIFGGSMFLSVLSAGVPGGMGGFGAILLAFYAAIILFGLYMGYLLYNFGKKTLLALNNDDQFALEEGAGNLGRLFKISGIIMIVLLSIYALILVFALLGGGFAALSR